MPVVCRCTKTKVNNVTTAMTEQRTLKVVQSHVLAEVANEMTMTKMKFFNFPFHFNTQPNSFIHFTWSCMVFFVTSSCCIQSKTDFPHNFLEKFAS